MLDNIIYSNLWLPRKMFRESLLEEMLEKVGGEVTRLVVHSLKNNTFYANLYIETEEGEWVLDCRPSDGMVLVTRLGAPIYLTPELLDDTYPSPQA